MGVFRCILEYKYPNELLWRYVGPFLCSNGRHFPAIKKLSYDNYLVAVNEKPHSREFQFTLLDGANCGSGGSGNNWTSLQIS